MILKTDVIAAELEKEVENTTDPLVICPRPNLEELRRSGAAAVDLRLGTWIGTLQKARIGALEYDAVAREPRLIKQHYVRFGDSFYIHPRNFVLGVTLEWLRIPANRAGYVVGKSSWGRRGLVIATAVGVHPGFTGCLTLEITNLGEMPIALTPGMQICQLFIHKAETNEPDRDASSFVGQRKPVLGRVRIDDVARKLAGKG